jgi:hypothetical protein
MTLSLYLQCVAMFILGQAIDLFLFKIPEIRNLYAKANEEFSWNKYWRSDWNTIIGTQLIGAVLIIGLDQLTHWKPGIVDYTKWFFAGFGAWGSSIVVAKGSAAKKYIMNIIDNKTNIADKVTAQKEN